MEKIVGLLLYGADKNLMTQTYSLASIEGMRVLSLALSRKARGCERENRIELGEMRQS